MTLVGIKPEKTLKEYCCICGSPIQNQTCPIHGLEFKAVLSPTFKVDFIDENGFFFEKIKFSYRELIKILPSSLKVKLSLLIDQLRAAKVIVIKLKIKSTNKDQLDDNINEFLTQMLLNHAEHKIGAFIFHERVLKSDGTKVYFAVVPEVRQEEDNFLIALMSKVLIVRNLWGYIRWREKLGAKPNHIIQSLKSTRRFVKTIDGFEGEIEDILRTESQRYSKILIRLKNGIKKSYRASEVFHDETAGITGIMAQYQINEALREFSHQFLSFVEQEDLPRWIEKFLHLKDAERYLSIYFEEPYFYLNRTLEIYLRNTSVNIYLSVMRRFWDYENEQIEKKADFLERWGKDTSRQNHIPLVLVSCTKHKMKHPHHVPALIRYQGPIISLIRRVFLLYSENNTFPPFNIIILSAKFGLLSPHQKIPYYDQIMSSDQLKELQPLLIEKLRSLKPKSMFINLSKTYFMPIELKNNLIKLFVAKGSYQERYDQTRKFLYELS